MTAPTLSVIIPSFEDPYRLSFVLEALCRQKSTDYQILVIDGGVVQVKDLILEFELRLEIEYYPLPEPAPANPGLTRNYGLARARAPRVLFLDQDSVPATNVLAEHAKYKDEPVVAVGFRIYIHQDDLPGITLDQIYNDPSFHYAADMRNIWYNQQVKLHTGWRLFYFKDVAYSTQMSVPTALARRLGGFDETMLTWGSEDIDLGIRLGRAGCFMILRPDLVVYHLDHPLRPRHRQALFTKIEPILNTTKMRLTEPLPRAYDPTEEHVYSWGKDHEGLAVISVITGSGGYAEFFLRSCDRYEIKPIVVGQGTRWKGFGTKINLLYYYLKQVELPPYILFVDGYDSVFQSFLPEIWQSYQEFQVPLVFSGDVRCWPDESLKNKFPSSPTVFRYLNAGGFIGETKFIIRMLEQLHYPVDNEGINEQAPLSHYFLSHQREIKLDCQARIFHSLYRAEDTVKFVYREKHYVNTLSGHRPHILHLNGQVKADSYAKNLGYDVTSYARTHHSSSGAEMSQDT